MQRSPIDESRKELADTWRERLIDKLTEHSDEIRPRDRPSRDGKRVDSDGDVAPNRGRKPAACVIDF